ncbi:ribonuclease H-like domain-containing protein [Paenibacillus sedimenti]|uniref:Ribonuclease H-like domain-containing protein n=1 Tax=Paenibacillus sedimenti TaxID=2770274 RepID=A0A926KM87_9BACL|nr:ribonuclease H-like domain-containing protein [Paenibacillus sedimenti]MBD0379371.1 ribonuclease H-like domain-containing protein [Paenibacillus sedimenti]
MSGLRERLSRLRGTEAAPAAPPPAPEAGGEWAQLGAHVETSPAGSFVMRRRTYGADSVHGKYRLSELAEHVQQLSCFHDRDAVVRIEELLFFDTETTGLGVGAGNVPFLVGIGYYSGELFIIEQLLIRNPAEEHAMLAYLQALLPRFTHIVSYNGRTFDWPILKNRYVLNRLKLDDSELLQLDLLYPSRSLWRNSLPSCRLSKVEESRLGFERVDDVPGSMAPTLYFQYLAEKDPSVLQGVFVHNEHDIVTLAALSIHFGKLLGGSDCMEVNADKDSGISLDSDPESGMGDYIDLEERYRTGLWLEKMGRSALAEQVLDKLFAILLHEAHSSASQTGTMQPSGAFTHSDQESTLLLLASFYKKKGKYPRSVELWKRWIEAKHASIALQLEPYLELAMYYEHREKNVRQALFYAEEAWAKLWRRRSLQRSDSKHAEAEEALERRIRRLKEKLQKMESPESRLNLSKTSQAKAAKPRRLKPVYVSEGLI